MGLFPAFKLVDNIRQGLNDNPNDYQHNMQSENDSKNNQRASHSFIKITL